MKNKTRLDRLKEQKARLEARIQLVESKEKTKEHKQDTRRKVLIGSYYLDKAKKDNSMDEIVKIMDKYLTRDNDRLLFDLSQKKR